MAIIDLIGLARSLLYVARVSQGAFDSASIIDRKVIVVIKGNRQTVKQQVTTSKDHTHKEE